MSSIYKTFTNNDKVSTRTLLHEAIPLTGTIVSGTYGTNNIKTYAHGMFQSVYDYPFLSSSANHIFDISVGTAEASSLTVTTAAQNTKKDNIYNQMAQVLMGYDASGATLSFDEDGDISGGGTKLDEVFFMNFSRLLVKDEIQKGTFQLELDVGVEFTGSAMGFAVADRIQIGDLSGSNGFFVNSPAGEYGILFASTPTAAGTPLLQGEAAVGGTTGKVPCGLLFYQAGVAVLSGSIFNKSTATGGTSTAAVGGILTSSLGKSCEMIAADSTGVGFDFLTGSTNDEIADAIRHRLFNVQFNNTIELNSTVYFCRANHNEFNYSANKTYLTGSQIRVKNQASDMPVSYITSIGLYSADGTLLGVSKLSEPIKKTPNEEYIFRVRVDY